MGYSCRADAMDTLEGIGFITQQRGGEISNELPDGSFYEISRVEHADGAITGSVMRRGPLPNIYVPCGRFRIEGNGDITRFPHLPPDIRRQAMDHPQKRELKI